MQTLLAYGFDVDVGTDRVSAGVARVEAWYGPLWGARPTVHDAGRGRVGLRVWNAPDEVCRWPAWSAPGEHRVASLQVPLGYERLVGPVAPATAALPLVRRLAARPGDVAQLTPPFVLAHLDLAAAHLTLITDGLGVGRLYEVATEEGWFYSNRPVAALLFAGVRAEADPLAWRRMAACDWAMGDATPYRGVRAVPAGSQIRLGGSGRHAGSLDALATLVGRRRDPLTEPAVDDAANALVETARAVDRLWPQVPILGLSGGRDSRLVVAAFVAAGVDVRLRTYGGAAGEEQTASRLVGLLPERPPHEITPSSPRRTPAAGWRAYEQARRWHDLTEGLRPALYLRGPAPNKLLRHKAPLVCGVGGEFGHAPGYPDDVERLEQLPLRRRTAAYAGSLQAKIVLPRGLADASVVAVETRIHDVLGHAADQGVTDAKALDWFYADERLRRWGLAGESSGRVLPLLVDDFVAAAFGLTTAQSVGSALHTALIDRLVPAWAGVPYFSATLKQRHGVPRPTLAQADDVTVLSGVFADPGVWGDAFDVAVVQSVWRQALAGRAGARDELLLQRVVWRAAFDDHLAAVNGAGRGHHPVETAPPPPGQDLLGPLRTLATLANDVGLARRLARTPFGRQVRRRLGV